MSTSIQLISRFCSHRASWTAVFLAVTLTLAALTTGASSISVRTESVQPVDNLPAAEFAKLVRDISEDGGYFRSDNFTSNETSYLHIVGKLREQGATGGAYIGVGPEQNFTYIAK